MGIAISLCTQKKYFAILIPVFYYVIASIAEGYLLKYTSEILGYIEVIRSSTTLMAERLGRNVPFYYPLIPLLILLLYSILSIQDSLRASPVAALVSVMICFGYLVWMRKKSRHKNKV